MKKLLITIACILGIAAGALLLWKVVIPILGSTLSWLLGGLESLF